MNLKRPARHAALLALAVASFAPSTIAAGPPEKDHPLTFRPAKGNFADPVPFFGRGEYHVFYLRGDEPKVPWEHIASRDLRGWRELPTALKSDGKPDGPDGLHMFTGSVIEGPDKTFHLYYTGWNPANPEGREFVMHATSPDLVAWTKHPEHKFKPDGAIYAAPRDGDFRDPFVFRNRETNTWWMLLCTRATPDNRPVTGVYESSDLVAWKPRPPLCDGYKLTPECPDLFRIGDLWYLIVSPSENVTTYRTAGALSGPWSPAPGSALETPIFYAAKSQFDGRRHVLTGWLRDLEGARDRGGFRWGGTQSLPREVFAGPDGALLSRPVPEAREPYTEVALDLSSKPLLRGVSPEGLALDDPGAWHYADGRLVASSSPTARARLSAPADYHLDLTVRLSGASPSFALGFRQGKDHHSRHYRLEVRPGRNEGDLATPGGDYPRPVPFAPGAPVRIEAFVHGPLIECFLNDSHAFSCRSYDFPSGDLDLWVTNGQAEITSLSITTPKATPGGGK